MSISEKNNSFKNMVDELFLFKNFFDINCHTKSSWLYGKNTSKNVLIHHYSSVLPFIKSKLRKIKTLEIYTILNCKIFLTQLF